MHSKSCTDMSCTLHTIITPLWFGASLVPYLTCLHLLSAVGQCVQLPKASLRVTGSAPAWRFQRAAINKPIKTAVKTSRVGELCC